MASALKYVSVLHENIGGFNFDNVVRNHTLRTSTEGSTVNKMTTKKTGTTICGVVVKGAVVLGADTRATGGAIVMDKNCDKIHRLADNIYTGGAGTAADLNHCTMMVESQLELHKLNTGSQVRVMTAVKRFTNHLYKYQVRLILSWYIFRKILFRVTWDVL